MRKNFFTGLAILLPFVVTIYIFHTLLRSATDPLTAVTYPLLHRITQGFYIFSHQQVLGFFSFILAIILFVLCMCFVGFVSEAVYIHIIMKKLEKYVEKVPLVNKVYKVSKEVTEILFFSPKKQSFSEAAWVSFPSKNNKGLGFVSKTITITCETKQTQWKATFVPNTPNPSTGFMVLFPEEKIEKASIDPEEAMKWVISCGSSPM